MKYTTALQFAATATAVVIPDEATAKQLVLDTKQHAEEGIPSWWDRLPDTFNEIRTTAEDTFTGALGAVDEQVRKLTNKLPEMDIESEITNFLAPYYYLHDENDDSSGELDEKSGHVGRPGHHGSTNLTVLQAIQTSNFTTKFAGLLADYPDLVTLLNSTDTNVTAFVPIDKAFEKIPDHGKDGKKPPKEFIEKLIKYHVLPDFVPARRVLHAHTLPTALLEEAIGGKPQRLRVSVGLFGIRLNFYSKIVVANLFCKNGIAHAIDSILVPPPPAQKLVELFPSQFSTLELAAHKTGLLHDDALSAQSHKTTGLTIFAPTNLAFRKLGPGANAFLFNTEKGLGFLKALLKYHVVVNQTLYSDAYYGAKQEMVETTAEHVNESNTDVDAENTRYYHVDLPTLLGDKSLSIDITHWLRFITIKVNGRVRVAVQDGIAKDGVLQTVNSVLIPPRKPRDHSEEVDDDGEEQDEISVEELIERLGPFLEGQDLSEMPEMPAKEAVWGEL